MTAIRLPAATFGGHVPTRRLLFVALLGAAVLIWILFNGQWTLPHDDDAPLFSSLNGIRDAVNENRALLDPERSLLGSLVGFFDDVLAALGWTGVIGLAGALGWVFGGWRLTVLVTVGFASLGVLGLWDESMATLSLMLSAVVIALMIGLPLGILAGRSNRVSAALSPILDVMQIMPTLAYLIPVTALFFIGAAPSVVATLVYAIPPAVRITSLGIRGVPQTTMEAARSLGSTNSQSLTQDPDPAGSPGDRSGDQPDDHAGAVDGRDHRG